MKVTIEEWNIDKFSRVNIEIETKDELRHLHSVLYTYLKLMNHDLTQAKFAIKLKDILRPHYLNNLI
jgi:hypothetical protein